MAIFKDISSFKVKQPTGSELVQVSATEAVTLDSIATLKSGNKGFISQYLLNSRDSGSIAVWVGPENLLPSSKNNNTLYFAY